VRIVVQGLYVGRQVLDVLQSLLLGRQPNRGGLVHQVLPLPDQQLSLEVPNQRRSIEHHETQGDRLHLNAIGEAVEVGDDDLAVAPVAEGADLA
jgi:hypothetical protein